MVAVGLGGGRRLRREERDDVGAEEEDGEAQEHELHAVHGGCVALLRSPRGRRKGLDDDHRRRLGILCGSPGRAPLGPELVGRPSMADMLGPAHLTTVSSVLLLSFFLEKDCHRHKDHGNDENEIEYEAGVGSGHRSRESKQ